MESIKGVNIDLHSHQHASILIPAQQRILSTPCFCILNISPAVHELFMTCDLSQLSRDSAVHILDDIEVSREEDIKVALVNL